MAKCECKGCGGRPAYLAEIAEKERELDVLHNRPKRIAFYKMLESKGFSLRPDEVAELAVWEADKVHPVMA